MRAEVEFTAEVFKAEEVYVALCPELNVSSFGDSVDEAKHSFIILYLPRRTCRKAPA